MATVCLARQPIFGRDLKVIAYELLFRNSEEANKASVSEADDATSHVLLNTLVEIGLNNVVGTQSAFVNFSSSFIQSGDCNALPADRIMLELLEGAEPTDALVTALKGLIDSGFRVALDDFVYLPGYERLLSLASIVKMDLRGDQNTFRTEVNWLKQFPVTLLAEKVETHEEFDRCRELGFSLFQGYFFARPRLVTGRRTPSDRLTTLRLIASLNAPNMSLKEVESLIVREPVLAQKLLKFINSTHVGLRVPVNSIGMAVALVGPRKLRSWATLLTLGRLTHCPREALVTANIRAQMCETLAKSYRTAEPESGFTVGLFSVLDVLAGRPMEEILAELPLSEDVKAALLGREGSLGTTLQAVLDYEMRLESAANPANPQTDAARMMQIYVDAVALSDAIFAELTV
ncbi:MAG TPA: HDOD domain-containing protein [Planctomycetaceae bacterium]|jgi:EAL and modified HD-GYP domain-containing signal transduction protein|nr:HDOD domain-containing protein [Planctomycetaceae bacterium]